MTPLLSSRSRSALALVGVGLASLLIFNAPVADARGPLSPRLDTQGDRWMRVAAPWLNAAEARLYLELSTPLQRERFRHRFWDQWPQRELERFQRNLVESQTRFDDAEDQRLEAMTLAGKPSEIVTISACAGVLRALEIWYFDPAHIDYQIGWRIGPRPVKAANGSITSLAKANTEEASPRPSSPEEELGRWRQGSRGDLYLLFVRPRADRPQWRWWAPRQGLQELMYEERGTSIHQAEDLVSLARRSRCTYGDDNDLQTLASALRRSLGRTDSQRRLIPPRQESLQASVEESWVEEFRQQRADASLASLAPPVTVSYPGRFQSSTLLRVDLNVETASLRRTSRGHLYDRIEIVGDIRRQTRLVDSFRHVHYLAGRSPEGTRLPLSLYRQLRPGPHQLDLRVEDSRGLALLRQTLDLEVPRLQEDAPAPAGVHQGYSALTRSEAGRLLTFPTVELRDPGSGPLAGSVELEAVTSGGPIESVRFLLDGAEVGRVHQAPFLFTLPLEERPQQHLVQVEALDPAGLVLARHARNINQGPGRFTVHLLPTPEEGWATLAEAAIQVPPGLALRRVRFSLDGELLAELDQEPFRISLPAFPPLQARWLRVEAELEDGSFAEDVHYVGSEEADSLNIHWIELWTTVTDSSGRFIDDLPAEAFRVLDDGQQVRPQRFQKVETLPLNLAVVMDTSSSMHRRLDLAAESLQSFFRSTLRPEDRASLTTFHHEIQHRVPFTDDPLALRYAIGGLPARGGTRLYDALHYALAGFDGIEGRRALVVLSDGRDVESDFGPQQILEAARRARVAVYPILLTVNDPETRNALRELADGTGGRLFNVHRVEQLDRVYRLIEAELRSQYLLVIRAGDGAYFRPVRVEVESESSELTARTAAGYYP
ncbi:MAG: VWA domain-containing protein [Acidobacteriota bacterium]